RRAGDQCSDGHCRRNAARLADHLRAASGCALAQHRSRVRGGRRRSAPSAVPLWPCIDAGVNCHHRTEPMAELPLAKIKVLDLTLHRAGPTCARQLADWGADVIKIETPGGAKGDAIGSSRSGADYQNLHHNKRAMTLNLKSEEGRAIFLKLA